VTGLRLRAGVDGSKPSRFDWRDVAVLFVEPAVVEPVDAALGDDLDLINVLPWLVRAGLRATRFSRPVAEVERQGGFGTVAK
jgi:hypothetical protein